MHYCNWESVENHWLGVQEILTSTCATVLGKKIHTNKDWISIETFKKIDKRRTEKAHLCNSKTKAAKATALEKYPNTCNEVKKCIRTDKRNHIDDLAKIAEKAAARRNMRELYDNTKKLAGKYQQTNKPV
jgi:hypothetical protein